MTSVALSPCLLHLQRPGGKKSSGGDASDDYFENRVLKPPPTYDYNPALRELAAIVSRDIYQRNPNVRWGDVVDLAGPKRLLKEAVVMPVKYPQLFTGVCVCLCHHRCCAPPPRLPVHATYRLCEQACWHRGRVCCCMARLVPARRCLPELWQPSAAPHSSTFQPPRLSPSGEASPRSSCVSCSSLPGMNGGEHTATLSPTAYAHLKGMHVAGTMRPPPSSLTSWMQS